MRNGRWSPDRFGGLSPSLPLRDRSVVTLAGGMFWGPNRPATMNSFIGASLIYSGDTDVGGDRQVEGLRAWNYGAVPAAVEVADDLAQQSFGATVQPGQTVEIPTDPLTQTWDTGFGPVPRWSSLSIRWRIPA